VRAGSTCPLTTQRNGAVWTPTQAGAFLDRAEGHDIVLYPMFVLILHRGLRRGEAVGPSNADVDLDTGRCSGLT
jgi:hypothetical protein